MCTASIPFLTRVRHGRTQQTKTTATDTVGHQRLRPRRMTRKAITLRPVNPDTAAPCSDSVTGCGPSVIANYLGCQACPLDKTPLHMPGGTTGGPPGIARLRDRDLIVTVARIVTAYARVRFPAWAPRRCTVDHG
jgi:hypothetical protein